MVVIPIRPSRLLLGTNFRRLTEALGRLISAMYAISVYAGWVEAEREPKRANIKITKQSQFRRPNPLPLRERVDAQRPAEGAAIPWRTAPSPSRPFDGLRAGPVPLPQGERVWKAPRLGRD